MDPIEISSSDSDFDLEEITETNASNIEEATNRRVLPHWESSNSRPNGYVGQSSKVVSPQSASTSSGSSRYVDNRVLERLPTPSNFNDEIRGSSQKTIQDPQNFREGESISQHRTVNSRIATTSGGDCEKLSSQQALKRTLPSTLQQYNPADHFHSSRDNNTYYNSRTSSMNGKGYVKEQFTRGNEEDLIPYEDSGRRLLPQTLLQGKFISASQFSAEPVYRPGMVDELVSSTDERLIYQAALQDLNQPKVEADLREGLLSVPLLRHQKIALAWMFQKETKSVHCLGGILADDQGLGKTISIIALIQKHKHSQLSSKRENPLNDTTEALNLDDDDDVDNGNTGSCNVNQNGEPDVKPIHGESSSVRAFNKKRPAAGTLVVCPASILRQWARELADKVPEEAKLSVLIYHGGNRTRDPVMLATYDVVLTTYSIVTNEVPKQPLVDEDDPEEKSGERYGLSSEISTNKKRKGSLNINKKGKKGKKGSSIMDFDCGPLAKVGWFRVVLDEAQTIKNHRTQVARACCSLRAQRRWCLSGTPIQNAIDDLYSYFRFLKYDPYAVYKSFYNTIKVPISKNSVHGYKKLQAVLRAIMLRRTKGTLIDGQPIVKLPPKLINLSKVDFSAEERTFYTRLEADSRTQFKAYAAAGTLNQNYANILLMLLRLRQACDHPLLVKGYNTGSVGKVSSEMARRLPKDLLIDLLKCLEASFAICRVCEDAPENPVVTACRHVFCYPCVSEFLTGDDNTCPAPRCKEQLREDVIFSKATLRSCISDDNDDISMNSESTEKSIVAYNECSSSKIRTVLEILQNHCLLTSSSINLHDSVECNGSSSSSGKPCTDNTAEGTTKAIVFSQWTTMLDLVELSLNQYCILYRRLDGTMSLAGRDRAVKEFNTDPEITVMLMSLKAGNLGLNMVAACHVILLDLWWNPTTEDQAIDRAHRIGQTRPVTVWRITIKDTVEDRIIALQALEICCLKIYFSLRVHELAKVFSEKTIFGFAGPHTLLGFMEVYNNTNWSFKYMEEKRKMVASAFGEDHMGASATRLTVEDLKYLFMGQIS